MNKVTGFISCPQKITISIFLTIVNIRQAIVFLVLWLAHHCCIELTNINLKTQSFFFLKCIFPIIHYNPFDIHNRKTKRNWFLCLRLQRFRKKKVHLIHYLIHFQSQFCSYWVKRHNQAAHFNIAFPFK